MDQTNIMILKVRPKSLPLIEIDASDSKRYISNLKEFATVACFPKNQLEWETVGITANGYNLTWCTRFEVHLDQVIDHAESEEDIELQA